MLKTVGDFNMNREEFKYAIIQQLDKNMDSFKYLLLEGDVVKKNTFNGYPYAKLQRYISKNYSLEILFELIN